MISCKDNKAQKVLDYSNAKSWKIKNGKNQTVDIKWKEIKKEDFKLKIPTEWELSTMEDVWIFINSSKVNHKLYYSIQKYDVSKIEMNDVSYLKEVFKQVFEYQNEFHYVLKKLTFKNGKNCYLLTLFTKEKGVDYITYDLIYQSDKMIYEFSCKTISDEKMNLINYRQFLLILQTLETDYGKIMDGESFIMNGEKELKFEDL